MKLTKFRIKNYKSIADSGDCYFADKFTILAGKNESGKTSILEALADFHVDKKIAPDKKRTKSSDEEIPTIVVSFDSTKDEVMKFAEEHNLKLKTSKDKIKFDIQKSSDTNQYSIHNLDGLTFDEVKKTAEEVLAEVQEKIKELPVNLTTELSNKDIVAITQKITQWISQDKFVNSSNNWQAMQSKDKEFFQEIIKILEEHTLLPSKQFIKKFIEKRLPNFILFSSFESAFPDSIKAAELKKNEWANDLEKISKFSIDKILHPDIQTQYNHQGEINIEFSEKFDKYWKQDKIKLQVNKNGEIIYFWIEENGTSYKPSQRSKGQQWYLSFYIKIIARISEELDNVILIDEPGLYLHARAQKDILKVLNDHNLNYPVVFSTHSPYLITEEKLGDIRLVEKNNGETIINNKVWAKVFDGETLTPILTAIGLGINDSITNLDQKNNIVAEGIEETFYLRAYYKLCSKPESPRINIISGGGTSNNMGKIGAILDGWGCQVVYIFDNDNAGKKGKKELVKLGVSPEQITMISEEDDEMTIDLLSTGDFKKFVLENEKEDVTKNSTYIKDNKLEKVLCARKFLDKVNKNEVSLSKESKDKIDSFFSKVNF